MNAPAAGSTALGRRTVPKPRVSLSRPEELNSFMRRRESITGRSECLMIVCRVNVFPTPSDCAVKSRFSWHALSARGSCQQMALNAARAKPSGW